MAADGGFCVAVDINCNGCHYILDLGTPKAPYPCDRDADIRAIGSCRVVELDRERAGRGVDTWLTIFRSQG
jgi:hypothetical protein